MSQALAALNRQMKAQFKNGLIIYDRAEGMIKIDIDEANWAVHVPSLNSNWDYNLFPVGFATRLPGSQGNCRNITMEMACYFKEYSHLYTKSAVRGCASKGEACYANELTLIDGTRVLVPLGYSQPATMAIEINAAPVTCDFYAGPAAVGQIYSGLVTYQAIEEGEMIRFTISAADGKLIKEFEYYPLTEKLDRKIIQLFLSVTDKVYSTDVMKGFGRVDRSDRVPAAKLAALQRLHAHAKNNGQITIVYKE